MFTGNGSGLSAIAGGNVTGTVANATYAVSAGSAGSATTAGTVTTAAQPNITSVGTLTGLGVNGTITGVNITANTGVFTGNGSGLSALAGGNVTGTVANATYATSAGSAGSATTAGTVTTAAQPNITSVGTLTSLGVNGTVTANTFTSNVATGTAPLTVTSTTRVANLNVSYANVADYINVTTANSGNVYLLFANAVTGNVTEYGNANFIANTSTGALYATSFNGSGAGLTSIPGGNVTGTVANATYATSAGTATSATSATSATTAGTVTTAAQPNITSVGTLTSLSVSGNANVGNIGATLLVGTLSTASQPNITAVGTLASLSVSGNANIGNIGTAGQVVSSIGTGTAPFTVLSTTKVANLNVDMIEGYHADTANSVNSVVIRDAAANIAVGNVNSSGGYYTVLSATGNVTGANVIATTYDITGVTTGITAAGTTQGTATALTKAFNVVSTVASGAGVVLPTAVAGMRVTIVNTSANSLIVYPASGAQVNALAANAGYTLPTLARLDYVATSTTQWYTMGAIYA